MPAFASYDAIRLLIVIFAVAAVTILPELPCRCCYVSPCDAAIIFAAFAAFAIFRFFFAAAFAVS